MNGAPKDGGPAFPMASDVSGHQPGMTLRDWFAGQALAGLLAGNYRDAGHYNLSDVPAEAVRISDALIAMLAARAAA